MAQHKNIEEVTQLLCLYGERVRTARMRRRWSQANLAERMNVERRTVSRLEKGDAGVTTGVLLRALWVLGLWGTAEGLADPAEDKAGIFLEKQREPARAGRKRREELDF